MKTRVDVPLEAACLCCLHILQNIPKNSNTVVSTEIIYLLAYDNISCYVVRISKLASNSN